VLSSNCSFTMKLVKRCGISRFFLDVNTIAFLKHYAEKQGLDFLCSAFGKGSLTELAVMGCKTVKVPAPCNEWDDYFYIARAEFSNLIISSGMTDKRSSLWRENDKILLCTSSYPCPYDQVNLNTLHDYDGISDHTKGIHIATAAVALGAQIVEKHMTIPWYNGPDKDASINPDEFKDMVTQIRQIEQAMGDGKHKVEECERKLTWRKRYV